MAPRTISQIAGEHALAREAKKDTFAREEQAVVNTTKRALDELRSQHIEQAAARGQGRSTFQDAIFAKKEADVFSNLSAQFANARTQEVLKENQFERDIIKSAIGTDNESRLLAQKGLQDISLEQEKGSQGLLLTGEKGLQDRLSLADQSQAALTQLEKSQQGDRALVTAQGEQQRLSQTSAANDKLGLLSKEAENRTNEINLQYENEVKLLNEKYARIRENLPFELSEKAKYEKEVLEAELRIQREAKLVDTVIQSTIGYILGNLDAEGGLGSGLKNILDDLGKNIF